MRGVFLVVMPLCFIGANTKGFSIDDLEKRLSQLLQCEMPCSYDDETSCPPGYHCDFDMNYGEGVCVQRDYEDSCYQVGLARLYNGKVSQTIKGTECQRWDSNTPHKPYHRYTVDKKFPEKSVHAANNYCRDPSNTGRPWCYTSDPNDRWDYCDVPSCYSRDCYRYGFAKVYQGYVSVTMDNIPCQRWDRSYPHDHKYKHSDYYPDESVEDAGNFCRSPSGAKIPWCYTTGSKRWQYCDIEQCPYTYCYDTDLSELYAGTVTKTQSGIKCQNWDSQYPHKHKYGKPEKFPEGDVSKAKNYCRDPSGYGKPWCYTTDHSTRWELCCVNNCSELE